jgi:orotate phosphoribosyltransferase
VAIFSYELKKAQDAFAADKVEYHILTNYNYLIEEAVASDYIKQEEVEKLLEWRNNL